MDFKEELKNYVKRIENTKDTLQTEEATKMALILPFFQLLIFQFCCKLNKKVW